MKKQLIYIVAVMFLAMQGLSLPAMASGNIPALKVAVNKYKSGNYTGCMQDCLNITYHNPKNATAYYYLAMSYAQTGQKDKAVAAYSKVLSLGPNAMLANYASTGKRCLDTPELCDPEANAAAQAAASASASGTAEATDGSKTDSSALDPAALDKFIANPAGGLSNSVKKDLEQQQLNNLKEKINNGQDLDDKSLQILNDASGQTAPAAKPTEEQVAAAMKVLNDAGVNPYSQGGSYQNPQAMQLQMLQSLNSNPVANPNDSSAMLNMIPAMLQQSKTGQGNYSPQLMQAFIMNSLTGSMNTDFGKNDNENDNNN